MEDENPLHQIIKTTSSEPSYLLQIPPEIRSEILKYVFISPYPIDIHYPWWRSRSGYRVAWTCRQLYAEVLPIFFGHNIFTFTIGAHSKQWLKQFGKKNWPLVKSVQLRMWSDGLWPKLDVLENLERIITRDKIFDMKGYKAFRGNGRRKCREPEEPQRRWCGSKTILSRKPKGKKRYPMLKGRLYK